MTVTGTATRPSDRLRALATVGLRAPRLDLLLWLARHRGNVVSGADTYDAYGGSGASSILRRLADLGVVVDVSEEPRVRRLWFVEEDHPVWDVIGTLDLFLRTGSWT